MKTLIGIDEAGAYKSAMCLIGRMRIPKAEFVLEHVMSPMPLLGPPYLIGADATDQYLAAVETTGRGVMDQAYDDACMRDMQSRKRLVVGYPSHDLVKDAGELGVDLVAVTATHQGRWGNSFIGSVSTAVATTAPCSVLVAKGELDPGAPVKLVLATDLSEYSIKCARELMKYKGKGITHVHIMTSLHINPTDQAILARVVPYLDYKTIFKDAETKIEGLADEFADAGFSTSWSVQEGHANDMIRSTMQFQKADLLAVGAQGKGFLERVFLGSVSLHQITSELYPVLVLRPTTK